MRLYDTTDTYKSIIHELWDLCDSDIDGMPLATAVRRVNAMYEELVALIINADGTWEFDDSNYTDLPRGKGTLVEGQENYTFASQYLQISQIEILDTNNRYIKIKPLDKTELGDLSPQEYFGVDSSGNPKKGFPQYFDQIGRTIFLYPAPSSANITLANGLRVWFKRTIDLFTTADTTQEPALPSTHHILLAYMAAIPYCMKYKPTRVAWLEKKTDEMKSTLMKHYGQREKARRKQMTMAPISFR